MCFEINSFANYVPELRIDNEYLSDIMDTSDDWIKSRTGISARHITKEENTSDFAVAVAKKLLSDNKEDAADIDLIIVATITPDYLCPSVACIVQKEIGAVNAMAFDISAACSGFIFAMSIASKFFSSGQCKKAIIIGAETMTKLVNWSDRRTAVLFGDGAGGVLLAANGQSKLFIEDIHSRGSSWESLKAGRFKQRSIGSCSEITLEGIEMDGREVFNFTVKFVPISIDTVIKRSGFLMDEIKYIVPHQANLRIVEAIAKKMKLSMDKFFININEYGNTSAASIPIALADMRSRGLLNKGDKVLLAGFGGGLSYGSILIEI